MPLFINNKSIIVPYNSLLSINELIELICKESGLSSNINSYIIKLNNQVLNGDSTIQQLGIKDKSNLIFESLDNSINNNNYDNTKSTSSNLTTTNKTLLNINNNNSNDINSNNSSNATTESQLDVSANNSQSSSHKRLFREYKYLVQEIKKDPSLPYKVFLCQNNLSLWNVVIEGPINSPYKEGLFLVEFSFPDEYPFRPLNVRFLTKIYHININDNGSVCLDILRSNFPLKVEVVIKGILSLLSNPSIEDSLDEDKLELYKSDLNKFNTNAQEYTNKFSKNSLEQIKKTHNLD